MRGITATVRRWGWILLPGAVTVSVLVSAIAGPGTTREGAHHPRPLPTSFDRVTGPGLPPVQARVAGQMATTPFGELWPTGPFAVRRCLHVMLHGIRRGAKRDCPKQPPGG